MQAHLFTMQKCNCGKCNLEVWLCYTIIEWLHIILSSLFFILEKCKKHFNDHSPYKYLKLINEMKIG